VRFSIDDPGPSGLFSGQATIRNNASQRLDGDWEVRLYKGSDLVATAQASGVPIDPGQTVTVQMQSSDHYVAGVDRYEFKTAATYRV